MSIKIKLRILMAERNIKQKELSTATGIRPNTISDMINDTYKHISKENLDKLCKYFNCGVNDIIEYIKE
ncbi:MULTISPECIES: helix-turn-helix transcriptional regulator [Clostridium]|jgi:putative transcriptional regulator|uniref:helix-turn-helix domain-containing protein n=1 Tax=Clostridium TaxID=1485 RepID=UPI000C071FDE|nr:MULTISPECIES: helix-turn-helix transcriptional regulator [Clostridium]MDU4726695.1 helix-turn-helix transcriptional regulator [Clostridium sp.]